MNKFISFLNADPKKTTVAFIPTAANKYTDKSFIEDSRKSWIEHEFKLKEVDIENKSYSELKRLLKDIDIIHVAGGNTFYLLQETLKSRFDKLLKELVEKGVVYSGESAGALLVCPTIEPVKTFDDPSMAPNLKTFKALHLVDFIILPHSTKQNKEQYRTITKKYSKNKFILLNDRQAVIVENNKKEKRV